MWQRLPSICSILVYLIFITEGLKAETIKPRATCYHHYLAGIRSNAVLPIKGHLSTSVSNILCKFDDDEPTSEIHSALEQDYHIVSRKSVNFQIADIYHLREIVRRSQCSQKLTINWKHAPEPGKGGIQLVSLLNETTRVDYNNDGLQELVLMDHMAGVRHLIPDEDDNDSNPSIIATPMVCKHRPMNECLFRGNIEIDLEANLEWSYTFAFQTDLTNQTVFTLRSADGLATVRIENDFFMRADKQTPIAIGHLSDGKWHTVTVSHSEPDRHYVHVDGSEPIEVSRSIPDDAKTVTLSIAVNGLIQLIDPTESHDDCLVSQHRRRLTESVETRQMCVGCGCPILQHQFDGLARCNDDSVADGYTLRRDYDRHTFLHVDDAFHIDPSGAAVVAVSAAFRSDSDAGLVAFGYWINAQMRGRLQLYYQSTAMHAIYCSHQGDDEHCVSCRIEDARGFGHDDWVQASLWGGADRLHLAVDARVCRLAAAANHSLAEVYAIPQFAAGSGLFIGGTWNEKKRRDLYRVDAEHAYLENTREKTPSLRGCVKNVYNRGVRLDLKTVLKEQMNRMLIDNYDKTAFAMVEGCARCEPSCEDGMRCRAKYTLVDSPVLCDCSDALRYNSSYGECYAKKSATPVVLSSSFLRQNQIVIGVHNSKALLSKVWLKFSLPSKCESPQTIVEFNSHRDKLFDIRLDDSQQLVVDTAARQMEPEDPRVHLLRIERRTPIGTRHHARKYDLYIDSWHTVIADIDKMSLHNITVTAVDADDQQSAVIIHDFGLSYEYDEHVSSFHSSNTIYQLDVHERLLPYQFRDPDMNRVGVLDDSLWMTSTHQSSPIGQIVDYTVDVIEPEQLLSSRWIIYSLFVLVLLGFIVLVIIICCCLYRRRSLTRSQSGSQRTIIRDSPDYGPVKMRDDSDYRLDNDDGSIGTDDTDLQAYRDIPSHRVKIYRESMVSILVPSIDQPAEAAIVKRPSNNQDAPLVHVNDD